VAAADSKGFNVSFLQPVWDAFRGPQQKPTVILLISPPLLLVWRYYATPEFLTVTLFAGLAEEDASVGGAMIHFFSCFALLGVVPALLIKMLFRDRLKDYGVQWAVLKRTLRSFLCLAPVFVLVGFLASKEPRALEIFLINPHAERSATMFTLHAPAMLSLYAEWEYRKMHHRARNPSCHRGRNC
jgi:hypothetical protein